MGKESQRFSQSLLQEVNPMHGRGLYVQTENESTIDILMVTPEGNEKWIFNVDPINDLMETIEIDYSEYRRRISQLHDLPLFQVKLDIAV